MELKLLEWNIHKMTNNISVKHFVIDTLISMEADVICLVTIIHVFRYMAYGYPLNPFV